MIPAVLASLVGGVINGGCSWSSCPADRILACCMPFRTINLAASPNLCGIGHSRSDQADTVREAASGADHRA